MKLNHTTDGNTISACLGITEERHNELQTLVQKTVETVDSDDVLTSDLLSAVAEGCNTPEELAWCSFQLGIQAGEAEGGIASIFEAMLAGTPDGPAEEGNDRWND